MKSCGWFCNFDEVIFDNDVKKFFKVLVDVVKNVWREIGINVIYD